jgi:predicted aldo/keto reductase-like oxidoreductase
MIPTMEFGRTGHISTRTIFGAAAFHQVTQKEADQTFELLQRYHINQIDTARSYGEAEVRIGPWMKRDRKDYFLATKTGKRTKQEALEELQQSLERLQTDHVDLWQMHCLVETEEWETAMGEGGALEALIEAKRQGLVRFLGVTGHGIDVVAAHLKSLERFDFDAVLFPYNYPMMQQPVYASQVAQLLKICAERNVAVQTIKGITRRDAKDRENPYATWYEPLATDDAIAKTVGWVLKNPQVFLNTASDIHLLPKILKSAAEFTEGPSDSQMAELVKTYAMEPLFTETQTNSSFI